MRQRCLILGGGGFIGSHLAQYLVNDGYNVRVFDVKNFGKKNLLSFIDKLEIVEGDFSNPVDVSLAIKDVDFIFHLISTTIPSNSVLNPSYDVESNVVPTINLLQQCVDVKIKKIIYLSSGGTVYGIPNQIPIPEDHSCNPINSYGITKRTIESYFKLYNKLWGLDACIFRLSNPYGERQNPKANQGVIPVFLKKAIENESIEVWGDGQVVRDYIYIGDVIRLLVQSIENPTPEIVYNVGSGIGTSLNELLNIIREKFNPQININYLMGRNFDVPINVLDTALVKSRFNWKPTVDLVDGLDILYNHLLLNK